MRNMASRSPSARCFLMMLDMMAEMQVPIPTTIQYTGMLRVYDFMAAAPS